jgi:KDO2-lipid IV(A) lauroyltransferase
MLVATSGVFRALPPGWVYAFARALGMFAYHVVRVRRGVVEENLLASLGAEKDERELARIARESYAHTAATFIEMFLFPDMAERVSDMVDMSEGRVIEDAYARGRGIVFVGCHFGSWEMSGACVGALGYPLTVVAKTQSNPHADAWINRHRERLHMRVISLGAPVKHIVRALRNGEIVGLISDQDAGSRGVFVDFFGRKASTPRGAAELAMRFRSPLLIGMTARTGPGRYRSMYREVEVRADDTVEILTQRYTRVIEDIVRQYPDQYFWMHRRWKSRPPGPVVSGEDGDGA